jgi:ferredoxin
MKRVEFRDEIEAVDVATSERLLDALLARDVAVKMYCKGRGLCSTCHVYVTAGADSLTPMTAREKLTLTLLTGADANSRLACQARVVGEGVEVELPDGLYVESISDIEALIGKRAAALLRHPVTGAVLVEANKLILRSTIMQLKDSDFDLASVSVANNRPGQPR